MTSLNAYISDGHHFAPQNEADELFKGYAYDRFLQENGAPMVPRKPEAVTEVALPVVKAAARPLSSASDDSGTGKSIQGESSAIESAPQIPEDVNPQKARPAFQGIKVIRTSEVTAMRAIPTVIITNVALGALAFVAIQFGHLPISPVLHGAALLAVPSSIVTTNLFGTKKVMSMIDEDGKPYLADPKKMNQRRPRFSKLAGESTLFGSDKGVVKKVEPYKTDFDDRITDAPA